MYFYLCDPFLGNKKKFGKILDKIETRLTDLELTGKFIRLTILESIQETVKEAIKKGATTVVAVGNDKTFCQVASALVYSSVVMGMIPIGESNLAKLLGLPAAELACDVLSARLIEIVDLGKVNDQNFFSSLKIKSHKIFLNCEGQYKIFLSSVIKEVEINNLAFIPSLKRASNPKDGLLEIVTQKSSSLFLSFFGLGGQKVTDSLFLAKKIRIEAIKNKKGLPVLIDQYKIIKTPLEIEVQSRALKIIVGRERKI